MSTDCVSTTDFCDLYNIEWFPINVSINGTEKVLNEIKHDLYKTIKCKECKKNKNDCTCKQPSFYPTHKPDIHNFSDRLKERQALFKRAPELFTHLTINTKNVFHIDIDTEDYEQGFNNIMFCSPYFHSMTKSYGRHIFIRVEDSFVPESSRMQFKNGGMGGVELLCGLGSYAPFEMHNTDKQIMTFNKKSINEILVLDVKQKRPTFPNSVIPPEQTIETKDKYLELLFNVIGNGKNIDYDCWFKIGCILKCNGYKFEKFEEYTAIVDAENPKTEKKWDEIDESRPISIYALQNIAKEKNLNGYFEWLDKYNEYITIDIIEKGVNEIAKFISKSLKSTLIYDNNTWYACKNNLWVKLKDPSATIVCAIEDELDKYLKILVDKLNKIAGEEEIANIRKKIAKTTNTRSTVVNNMNQYAKLLNDYLWVKNFNECLDTNIYQIAFKNGIFDLRSYEFRQGIFPSDFITQTLPYNYQPPNQDDILTVRGELKKICNYNETHLEYYLSIIGYALTGDAMGQQEFYYLRGQKAGNGKSVIFEAFDDILPIYSMKMESDVFNENNSNRHKEIATWAGKRIAWANEIGTKKLDRELIKDVSDGTKVKYKPIYKDSEYMPITFKAFIISNNTINFDSDEGVKRRMRLGQMDSEFIEGLKEDDIPNCRFKKDNEFGKKLRNEYKFGLLHLLFQSAKKYIDKKFTLAPYPDDWKEEAKEVVASNDNFKEWFLTRFEFVEGKEIISEYNLKKIIKTAGFDKVKFSDQVKKNRWTCSFDRDKRSWSGLKEKEECE